MEKAEWDISTCSVVSRRKDRAKEEMNCGTADDAGRQRGREREQEVVVDASGGGGRESSKECLQGISRQ